MPISGAPVPPGRIQGCPAHSYLVQTEIVVCLLKTGSNVYGNREFRLDNCLGWFLLPEDVKKVLDLLEGLPSQKIIDLVLEKEHNYTIIRGVDQILIFVGLPTPPGRFDEFNTRAFVGFGRDAKCVLFGSLAKQNRRNRSQSNLNVRASVPLSSFAITTLPGLVCSSMHSTSVVCWHPPRLRELLLTTNAQANLEIRCFEADPFVGGARPQNESPPPRWRL